MDWLGMLLRLPLSSHTSRTRQIYNWRFTEDESPLRVLQKKNFNLPLLTNTVRHGIGLDRVY